MRKRYAWKGFSGYGDDVIGISGCGPACLSMVACGLLQDSAINPKTVADYAMENQYYVYGTGTKWALFEDYAESMGLSCTEIGADAEGILSSLKNNPQAPTPCLSPHYSDRSPEFSRFPDL